MSRVARCWAITIPYVFEREQQNIKRQLEIEILHSISRIWTQISFVCVALRPGNTFQGRVGAEEAAEHTHL